MGATTVWLADDMATFRKLPSGGPSCSATRKAAKKAAARTDAKLHRWWRLVWCHERCFLPVCEHRRQSLSEAARTNGASLICLKRAARLESWLEERAVTQATARASGAADEGSSDGLPPYVLMADWRDAMSCADALAHQQPVNRPAFTVVFCEQADQMQSMMSWAQQMPEAMNLVYLCGEMGPSETFLACLVGRLLGSTHLPTNFVPTNSLARLQRCDSLASSTGSSLSTTEQLQIAGSSSTDEERGLQRPRAPQTLQGVMVVPAMGPAGVLAPWMGQGTPWPAEAAQTSAAGFAPSFVHQSLPQPQPLRPASPSLAPWLESVGVQDTATLDRLLRDAMPERYDD